MIKFLKSIINVFIGNHELPYSLDFPKQGHNYQDDTMSLIGSEDKEEWARDGVLNLIEIMWPSQSHFHFSFAFIEMNFHSS